METATMASPWAHKLPPGSQRFSMDPKERFYRQFQASVASLQDQIAQLGSVAAIGGERQDAIENVLAGISRLSNEVADASDFIPAYDQRSYSQTIKSLTESLNTTTAQLAPKSRFHFKPRAAPTSSSDQTPTDTRHMLSTGAGPSPSSLPQTQSDTLPPLPTHFKNYNEELSRPSPQGGGIRKPSFSAARSIAISDHSSLHIILPPSAARATSAGQLTSLKKCVVDMSVPTTGRSAAPFASLALRDIESCLIVAGRVSGATHITGVKGSVVVVVSGQVRIHECVGTDFYVWCGSRVIIEDCERVRFAPVPEVYMTDQEEKEKNMWDQVDDFKWLKEDQKSPNWSILPEEERLPERIWRETVPGRPGQGLDDILKEVGILKT